MSKFLYSWEIDYSLNIQNENIVEVITYANKSNYYFPYLLKSADKNNYPLKILGWGTEWKGYCSKIKIVYEYLITLPNYYKNRYMLLVDAWDVIFAKSYEELIAELNNIDYDLIISSNSINTKEQKNKLSKYCQNYFASKAFGAKKIVDSINAGVYIIKINKFIDMYNKMLPKEEDDDQVMLTKYLFHSNFTKPKYIIDHGRYFFLTINLNINIEYIINSLEKNKIKPFIIHAHSNSPMDRLLKLYYKNISLEELNNMRPNSSKQLFIRTPHFLYIFLNNNITEILLLSMSIILIGIKFIRNKKLNSI
jgi:hypothetical protein